VAERVVVPVSVITIVIELRVPREVLNWEISKDDEAGVCVGFTVAV
jgi:hypothetical protein